MRRSWYRLDSEPPAQWSWAAFPGPRYRFDSASGSFRVRYAGQDARVAMRERFDETARRVDPSDLDTQLVRLDGDVQVLDLRRDQILDALRLDDQINTSRAPGVWTACQQLVDRVHAWFGERCDGLVYRSRTTPQRSANLVFFAHAPFEAHPLGTLREQATLIDSCILSDGFLVRGWR